jgi:outer membrane protein
LTKHFVLSIVVIGFAALTQAQAQTPPAGAPPAAAPSAPRPTKFGYIFLQQAVVATKEGQKVQAELQSKYAPKRNELEKKTADISALNDQLKKGGSTMSEDARTRLERDIEAKTKLLNRDTEDAQADMETDGNKAIQSLAGNIYALVGQYATSNGYAVILDISNQQANPVFWAAPSTNITGEIIKLYDQAHPVMGTASAPPASKPPVAPPTTKK